MKIITNIILAIVTIGLIILLLRETGTLAYILNWWLAGTFEEELKRSFENIQPINDP